MVLIHPFFKLYNDFQGVVNEEKINIEKPDIWPSCFENKDICLPPENDYKMSCYIFSPNDQYIYTPKKLTVWDTISYLELKKEIEQEKIELINKRRVLDAGMVPNEDGEEPAKKVEDFLLSKMDFTEHYIDREVIKQFVHTIVPVTETCFNWYMNFDLIEKPNDMKKLVWEFTIDYKSALSYRKEKNGMLRQNQWQDLTVRVFI